MTEDDRFIVDQFVWSYSRLTSFNDCPYAWYQKYINCESGVGNAFASYGTFCHKLLEQYANGDIDIFTISQAYEEGFDDAIPEDFPPNKYVDLRQKYYDAGVDYFENIDLPIDEFKVIGVEKKVEFTIAGKKFVGFIDLLLEDKDNGELILCDHKSACLKFNKNGSISKGDSNHYLSFKRQLYMYSKPLIEAGYKISRLKWNMFRSQQWIDIPWDEKEYNETLDWAEKTLSEIENETSYAPNPDFYFCNYICDQRECCEYRP